MNELTPKQLAVLRFIIDYRAMHSYSPTLREIAAEIGRNKVTVFAHVTGLKLKGFLVNEERRSYRNLRPTAAAPPPRVSLAAYHAMRAVCEAVDAARAEIYDSTRRAALARQLEHALKLAREARP